MKNRGRTSWKVARLFFFALGLAFAFPGGLAARKDLDSIRKVVSDPGRSIDERMDAIHWIAFFARYSDPDSSAYYADSLLRMAGRTGNRKYQMLGHDTKTFYFRRKAQMDSATYHGQLMLQLAHQIKDLKSEADALCSLGTICEDQGNLDQAYEYYQKCKSKGEESGDPTPVARALINLGFVHKIRADFVKALDYLQQAQRICYANLYTGYYPTISMSIGDIHRAQGELARAAMAYRTGLSEAQGNNNRLRVAQSLVRLAEVEFLMSQTDSALQHLRACMAMGSEIQLETEVAGAEFRIAEIFLHQGYPDSAAIHARSSLKLLEQSKDSIYLAQAHEVMGRVLLAQGKSREAERICAIGRQISKLREDIPVLASNCKCLYQAQEAQGQGMSALASYKEYVFWRDSLLNQTKTRQLARREAEDLFNRQAYQDSLEYEGELELQRQTFQEKEAQQEFRFGIAVVGVLVAILMVLLLLVLFFTIRRSNRLLGRKNLDIEKKAAQVARALADKEVLLKEVHHRVKNNLQVVSSLLDMQVAESQDESARRALIEGQNRVTAMSLIHMMLYQNEDLDTVEMRRYIDGLSREIAMVFEGDTEVRLEFEIEDLKFDIDQAVPLGLILNELITNSFKYAFPGLEDPYLSIRLCREDAGFLLEVHDNGPGLGELSAGEPSPSLGLQLVRGLVSQLGGKLESWNKEGAWFSVRF